MRNRILLGLVALLAAGSASASTVLGLSVEDQARLSTLVVAGEVIAQKGVDHPAFGIETEVTLRVTDVFKGAASRGDLVVFHTRSGQVGDEVSEASGEAKFLTGKGALVFIESVDGRLYNLGLSMGVWSVHEARGGRLSFTRAVQDGLDVVGDFEIEQGPISLRDMANRITFAAGHPEFDNPVLRDAFLGRR